MAEYQCAEGAILHGVDLRNARLCGADFRSADLREADFSGADLRNANLHNTDLHKAILRGTILQNTRLRGASLRKADLYIADLRDADLQGADLQGAVLRNANLQYADLRCANLFGADLSCAILYGADLRGAFSVPYIPMVCPEEGDFIGWKKIISIDEVEELIVKLHIPVDAKRSSATTRKCRCSKAEVIAFYNLDGTESRQTTGYSTFDCNFIYKVGDIIEVPDFDEDRWNECAHGIHFFINRQEAVGY